jgi:hypothetical protein
MPVFDQLPEVSVRCEDIRQEVTVRNVVVPPVTRGEKRRPPGGSRAYCWQRPMPHTPLLLIDGHNLLFRACFVL